MVRQIRGQSGIGPNTMKRDIAGSFRKHFEAYLNCLAETVQAVPEDQWTKGSKPRAMPVHQACHAMDTILGYAGADWDYSDILFGWKPRPEYPSRERLVTIIDRAKGDVTRYIAEVSERALADRDWSIPPLFKLIYLFRHSVWHLCCLHEALRSRGIKAPEYAKTRWRPRS